MAVVPAKTGTHTPQHVSSAEAYGSRVSLRWLGTTEFHKAFTMLSVIFFASPKSIIVLSR
jgi:hypothetical protein